MKPPTLAQRTIRSLRSDLLARRFAVPKLQRNFVWDPGRAAKLLDSIYRDMPIGSLFLWEMDRKSAHLIRQSTQVLPPFDSTHKHIWFVIDGQQRLSVIHQAFEAQIRQNDAGREIDFGRLCFVVHPDRKQTEKNSSPTDQENEESTQSPPRIVYRKPIRRQLIPIHDILAPDWKRRMPSNGKGFLARVRGCRQRLMGYPVPIVTVRSATLDEIGEVFIRVNSQGMRITSADRAIALMGKLDVRAIADELRQKVRKVFDLGGIDPILRGFNLIAERPQVDGDPPKLDAMAQRWSRRIERNKDEKEKFRTMWDKYQGAFQLAVDHLRGQFPVHDESYLPSANMLATLSVFFFHHPGQPNGHQASQIRRWFWATGVAQRYTGAGYHRNIVADANLFESLAHGAKKYFVFRDLLDPILHVQGAEYASRSARTRTIFCLLASLKPRYLENGEQIRFDQNIVSHANGKHRHHVFPQAQLKNHFPAHVYNSLCNICFLVSRDNEKIGMRLPRYYLTEYRDAGRKQFNRVMKSHLIPARDDDGIWDVGIVKAFKRFRQHRLALICAALTKAAGIKLFKPN
jgi:hypothetical protein